MCSSEINVVNGERTQVVIGIQKQLIWSLGKCQSASLHLLFLHPCLLKGFVLLSVHACRCSAAWLCHVLAVMATASV